MRGSLGLTQQTPNRAVNDNVRTQSKVPPVKSNCESGDATVRLADGFVKPGVPGAVTVLERTGPGAEASAADSCLVRIRDGQVVELIDPRGAMLPEERYRYPRSGEGELGKGGIGQVNLVFDCVLGREVAMKALRNEFLSSDVSGSVQSDREALWRFMREARVTGQLEHPNIVPVYELGQRADKTLYYTMRAVRGRTLGEALRQAATLTDRLKLLPHLRMCVKRWRMPIVEASCIETLSPRTS